MIKIDRHFRWQHKEEKFKRRKKLFLIFFDDQDGSSFQKKRIQILIVINYFFKNLEKMKIEIKKLAK